jgi:single-stranded-DNA-specific exonuclease
MSEFFSDIGKEISLIIPNRFHDGYGINEKLLERIDADVIITVDNGISAVAAAKVCKERGIDLIITDHHTVPETIPDAYAIINPKQEDCPFPSAEICGAQVAWYLVAALKEELALTYHLGKFLDLLAIAIVADMMELKDINRTMVRAGFKMINQEKRVIFSVIKRYFKKSSFKSDDISFLLAPIINSAGRIEDAMLAFKMLSSKSEEEALMHLEYIVGLNNRRKEIELELFNKAVLAHNENAKIIVAWGEDWHEGVIGIVAARLTRKFKKPAIVLSVEGGRAKGSARSIGTIHILNLIATQKELLLGFGGHQGAAGMAIEVENLELFKANLEALAEKIPMEDFIEKSEVLGEIEASAINFDLLHILEKYEPYGQKNPQPKFLLKNAYVSADRLLGIDANHLKMTLICENHSLEAIYFNCHTKATQGEHIDLVCTISKNEFRGNVTPQLMVQELYKTSE